MLPKWYSAIQKDIRTHIYTYKRTRISAKVLMRKCVALFVCIGGVGNKSSENKLNVPKDSAVTVANQIHMSTAAYSYSGIQSRSSVTKGLLK